MTPRRRPRSDRPESPSVRFFDRPTNDGATLGLPPIKAGSSPSVSLTRHTPTVRASPSESERQNPSPPRLPVGRVQITLASRARTAGGFWPNALDALLVAALVHSRATFPMDGPDRPDGKGGLWVSNPASVRNPQSRRDLRDVCSLVCSNRGRA